MNKKERFIIYPVLLILIIYIMVDFSKVKTSMIKFKWLQLIIPSMITIIGWIALYFFNNKFFIENEKKISIKIDAYKQLKEKIEKTNNDIPKLDDKLKKLKDSFDIIHHNKDKKGSINKMFCDISQQNKKEYIKTINNLSSSFKKNHNHLLSVWNQYRLVFKKFSSDLKKLEKSENKINKKNKCTY